MKEKEWGDLRNDQLPRRNRWNGCKGIPGAGAARSIFMDVIRLRGDDLMLLQM